MSWDFLELNVMMSTFGTIELPHDAYFMRSTLWGSPIRAITIKYGPTFWGSWIPRNQTLDLLRPDRSSGAGFAIPENRVATLTLRVITVSVPLQ